MDISNEDVSALRQYFTDKLNLQNGKSMIVYYAWNSN